MKFPRILKVASAAFLLLSSGLSAVADPRLGLSVKGGNSDLRDEIIAVLSTRSLLVEGETEPQGLIAAAQADYRRILAALYAEGYYGPVVSIRLDGREAAEMSPFAVPTQVGRIDVIVDPGPLFRFGRTEIAPLAPRTALPEGFRRGATARVPVIEEAGTAAIERWRELGFAKTEVTGQRITATHPARQIDVGIGLNPGRKLRFGNLIPRGNQRVRTDRIIEIAGLPRGETFHPDEVDKASTRLQRTGAFRSVALTEALVANRDGTLDINAELVEAKRRRLGVGAELTTLEGATLSAFWLHRNLLGGAERLRFDGEISNIGLGGDNGVDYRLSVLYGRPGTFNPDTDLYIRAALEHEDEPLYLSDSFEIEGGVTRIVNEEYKFQAGLGLLYSHTEDDIGIRDFTLLTLPFSGTLDRRDNDLDPKNGYYLNVDLTPFVGVDGSGAGARLYADARGYRSFGEAEKITLAGRLQVGSVMGTDVAETVPDYLFYSGGGGTVRGQPYQSLGVTLPAGEEIGGASFVGASVELRGQVSEKIQLVGFYDFGLVGAESMPGSDGESHAGAGIGIRYQTGLGPIRLDVATPVGGDTGDGVELYIGIGQAF
ncbi:autotransporter assembly complex protein TamA [Vannielia litorea]|uniref:Autotransporter secretion outer membrane protein TamA n=1 Tax=Vannielia litorea TaxID=1217970 RepID=A0A1N6E5R6_9RHOB|nr:BamA/TamA family outer membrane protein [Vannielia litorea]SIN78336.1 autotransporter secretion outer membrane protein TamA [Vannielia litorea]